MSTGVLERHEPQPTGKLPSSSEGPDMPYGPGQGRRGRDSNAGDLVTTPFWVARMTRRSHSDSMTFLIRPIRRYPSLNSR